jgi:hypothetical protein
MQYIYKTSYHYRSGFSNWQPFALSSAEPLIVDNWYPKTAHGTIATDTAIDNYVLGYICTWNGSQWKCGCRDSVCTQSYWQIQSFRR